MSAIIALFVMLLGFVPYIVVVALIVTALWAATKLFPEFGARLNASIDRLFGVDADYDEKHNTGNTPVHFDQYV